MDDDLYCMLCDFGGWRRPRASACGAHLGNQGDQIGSDGVNGAKH